MQDTEGATDVKLFPGADAKSTFSKGLSGLTTVIKVTPFGHSAVDPLPNTTIISGNSITYDIYIEHDVTHSGDIRLTYGGVYKDYTWSTGLNGDNIYRIYRQILSFYNKT